MTGQQKGITVRKVGALCTIGEWEDLLATLPHETPTDNGNNLGLLWEQVENPRIQGNDPIVKRGYRLAIVPGVRYFIPKRAELIEIPASPIGSYTLVKVDGIAIHLRNGVQIVDGVVIGDLHICVRAFWPRGAEKREPIKVREEAEDGRRIHTGKKNPWKNYLLYLDLVPSTAPVTRFLRTFEPGHERPKDMDIDVLLASPDGSAIRWATRSANWSPAVEGKPAVGSDQ